MKLSTPSTILKNLTVKQNVMNSIVFVCHVYIENYNISFLSCCNGFLNGSFETKVRQNNVKKNISVRYIKLINMNQPNKNGETFQYGLIRGIIPWMTKSRYHYEILMFFVSCFILS